MNDSSKNFETWIDIALASGAPCAIAAFNFNIYEEQGAFSVELVGAPSFDEEDPEWACDDVLNSEAQRFYVPIQSGCTDWHSALALVQEWLVAYLASGSAGAARLRESEAVAVGFVDGDLEIVWRKDEASD